MHLFKIEDMISKKQLISLQEIDNIFFIGVAGSGMSALAQYAVGIGKTVSGSDRFFVDGLPNDTRTKLEAAGVHCFLQDGSGISDETQLIVASTAVEDTVPEIQIAKQKGIPIIKRSEMLALICDTKRTIAIAGTSGKSTVAAMLYHILKYNAKSPGIISGAGLTSLILENKIGNADAGNSDLLVIEADESDGSIVQYQPWMGVLLNVDKDHQEMDELVHLFSTFKQNCQHSFITNMDNPISAKLATEQAHNFGKADNAYFRTTGFVQDGFTITFSINDHHFSIAGLGEHTMQNAAAASAAAVECGVTLEQCSAALESYQGIYRRHQVLGKKSDVWLIDDYAHNPAKCAASIRACQSISNRVIAWFQPHGYGPTRFLRDDFVSEIGAALRPQDEIWMSEIFYAGGTAEKNISSANLIGDLQVMGKRAHFVEDRANLLRNLKPRFEKGDVLLLMGARDPSLENFAQQVYSEL